MTKLIVEDDSIPYGLYKLARDVVNDASTYYLDKLDYVRDNLPRVLALSEYGETYFVFKGGSHVAILTEATARAVAARVILITE